MLHHSHSGSAGCWARASVILLALACLATPAAPEEIAPPSAMETDEPTQLAPQKWYFFVAAVNVYPKLQSEEIIGDLVEPLLGVIAPGHEGIDTISELRDDHLLWPPHLGLGYNLNDKWSLFLEAGYTAGKVRTRSDDPSVLGLPLHTDFEIFRSALFGGVGVDYFPLGMPEQREYDGLADRLTSIRPFLGTRVTWTYATYRVKAKFGVHPLPNLVNLELSDAWVLPSATFVGGFDLPLSKDTTLTVNAGYNYFQDQEFDFEGGLLTVQWRRYFNGPRRLGR
jgi:hypothetical protein